MMWLLFQKAMQPSRKFIQLEKGKWTSNTNFSASAKSYNFFGHQFPYL